MANELKTRIMRRIYAIWFVRRGLPMIAGSAASFYIALRVAAERFFVAQIVSNFAVATRSGFLGMSNFVAAALNSVEPSVLILISLVFLVSWNWPIGQLRAPLLQVPVRGAALPS